MLFCLRSYIEPFPKTKHTPNLRQNCLQMKLEDDDNERKKVNSFHLDVKLECSFMDGQITLGGSAKFLSDNKVFDMVKKNVPFS